MCAARPGIVFALLFMVPKAFCHKSKFIKYKEGAIMTQQEWSKVSIDVLGSTFKILHLDREM
jgi:hypothetical protein